MDTGATNAGNDGLHSSETSALHLSKEDGPASAKIRSLLGKRLRVVISDKRIFVGTFDCFDQNKNIILTYAQEWTSIDNPDSAKSVGQVLVPGEHIVSCDVEKADT